MSRRRLSTSLTSLRSIQRFRRLSTWFSLRRNQRKLLREQTRLSLLEKEHRHQLLLLKELQQRQQQLLHRQEELTPQLSPVLLSSSPSSTPNRPEQMEALNSLPKLSPMLQEFLQELPPVKDSTLQQ